MKWRRTRSDSGGVVVTGIGLLLIVLSVNAAGAGDGPTGTELVWRWFKSKLNKLETPKYNDNLVLHHVDPKAYANATCMDGSQAGFYLSKSVSSPNWLIHLQAGGSCTTLVECMSRTQGPLGSSRYFDKVITGEYLLSDDPSVNPSFHSWTKVLIPYCSGDVFVGRKPATNHPLGLSMTGHYIIDAVIRQLIRDYGINNSEAKILFGGTSAGGIGVIANVDYVRRLLLPAEVKSYNDGGWFSMFPNFGEHTESTKRPDFFRMLSTLFNGYWDGFVDETCRQYETEASACLYGELALRHISTPMYVMSPRWDTYQLTRLIATGHRIVHLPPKKHKHRKYLSHYGNHTHHALLEVMRRKQNGVYSPACFSHAFLASCSDDSICYFPPSTTFTINGKTAYEGLAEWYKSGGREGSYLDQGPLKTVCNPSCCSHLCRKCHAHSALTKSDVTSVEDNTVELLHPYVKDDEEKFFTLNVFQKYVGKSSSKRNGDFHSSFVTTICLLLPWLLLS